MAANSNLSSIAISRKGNLLSVPTHITETTKILKENGETVEIVTVTLGAPGGTDKVNKALSIGHPKSHVTIFDEKPIQTTAVAGAAGELIVSNSKDGNVTLVSVIDGVADSSNGLSGTTLSQVGDEMLVQASANMNDYSCCMVCGDRGSGFHYSVFSCEGCKGFFKRSVQKNLTYTCKNDGNCDINKYSRNNCQYCRFKKCLQFGMKKEGVRDDRLPGGLNKTRFRRMRIDLDDTENTEAQLDLESSIQTLINCDPYISPSFVTTEEKTATLYGAFQLTAILYDDLTYAIRWARQIPGFRDLDLDDQKILLSSSLVELSLFRLTYRSLVSTDGRLRYAHDIELTLSESEQLGFEQEYVDTIVELVALLRNLMMDDKEYAIISAIVLFYEDAIGLRDTITVLKLQQRYLMLLQKYIKLVYSGDMQRFGRLLLSLTSLRTKAVNIAEVFGTFIVADRPAIQNIIDEEVTDEEDLTVDHVVITSAHDMPSEVVEQSI